MASTPGTRTAGRARALPGGVSWSDLLHEAVLRALAGTRPWPPGVPLVAFLAGVMRSLVRRAMAPAPAPGQHARPGRNQPRR